MKTLKYSVRILNEIIFRRSEFNKWQCNWNKIQKFEIIFKLCLCDSLYRNIFFFINKALKMQIGNSLFWSWTIVSNFLPGIRDTSASHKDTSCYTVSHNFFSVVRRHQSTDINTLRSRNLPECNIKSSRNRNRSQLFLIS